MNKVRNKPKINPTRNDAGIVKPDVIELEESEHISLNALARNKQLLRQEVDELNKALRTRLDALKSDEDSEKKILGKIETVNALPLGTLAAEYQHVEKQLVKASR